MVSQEVLPTNLARAAPTAAVRAAQEKALGYFVAGAAVETVADAQEKVEMVDAAIDFGIDFEDLFEAVARATVALALIL